MIHHSKRNLVLGSRIYHAGYIYEHMIENLFFSTDNMFIIVGMCYVWFQ